MAGRLGDEGDAVPVGFGKLPRRVDGVAGGGGEAIVKIYLADRGNRMIAPVVGHAHGALAEPAAHRLEIAIGDRQVRRMFAVGRRIKNLSCLADSQAPSIVGRRTQKLQLRAVRLEAEKSLTEAVALAADLAVEASVTDRGVNPVVESET